MKNNLRKWIKPNFLIIITGIISGLLFILTAVLLMWIIGVEINGVSYILARPDVYAEPDITGWFYFILALVPAIWEEIIFRGIILKQLRTKFSDKLSIFNSTNADN